MRVSVIATGGTIVSANHGAGASPDAARTVSLLDAVRGYFAEYGIECSFLMPFGEAGFDSSDIGPKQWCVLAACVASEADSGACGVVIMHGTDTMAYTSAWLSLCFPNIHIPVVLTGSQRTQGAPDFDGARNLRDAASVVARGTSGVWICFNGRLFDGGWAHKAHATDLDAYVAIGREPLDVARPFVPHQRAQEGERERLYFSACPAPYSAVACIAVQPGVSPLLSGSERIVVISGFGAGNAPHSLHRYITALYSGREKPLIIACSQAEHGRKAPLAYDGVGLGSLASEGCLVWSQGERPLEFVVALAFFAMFKNPSCPGEELSRYLERIVIE